MDYENMTVAELKDLLRDAGLPVSGKKADLVARLQETTDASEDLEDVEDVIEEEMDVDEDEFESDDFFEDSDPSYDFASVAKEESVPVDNSPKSILIWRALLQWLGGIGVIVMAITILPLLNIGGMQLFRMESGDSAEKILPKTREITLIISIVYLSLTFLCAISYWFVGMNFFDSVSHAMTTIATGGFSTHTESIGYFQNAKIGKLEYRIERLERLVAVLMEANKITGGGTKSATLN